MNIQRVGGVAAREDPLAADGLDIEGRIDRSCDLLRVLAGFHDASIKSLPRTECIRVDGDNLTVRAAVEGHPDPVGVDPRRRPIVVAVIEEVVEKRKAGMAGRAAVDRVAGRVQLEGDVRDPTLAAAVLAVGNPDLPVRADLRVAGPGHCESAQIKVGLQDDSLGLDGRIHERRRAGPGQQLVGISPVMGHEHGPVVVDGDAEVWIGVARGGEIEDTHDL